MGGKYQTPSKFCSEHEDPKSVKTSFTPLDYKYYQSKGQQEVSLPDSEESSIFVGCKKLSNVNRFYDRTAGTCATLWNNREFHRDVHM